MAKPSFLAEGTYHRPTAPARDPAKSTSAVLVALAMVTSSNNLRPSSNNLWPSNNQQPSRTSKEQSQALLQLRRRQEVVIWRRLVLPAANLRSNFYKRVSSVVVLDLTAKSLATGPARTKSSQGRTVQRGSSASAMMPNGGAATCKRLGAWCNHAPSLVTHA